MMEPMKEEKGLVKAFILLAEEHVGRVTCHLQMLPGHDLSCDLPPIGLTNIQMLKALQIL